MWLIETLPTSGKSIGTPDYLLMCSYREDAVLEPNDEARDSWWVFDSPHTKVAQFVGRIDLPDGRWVAPYEIRTLYTQRWRTLKNDDGTEWALPVLRNPSFTGARRKGIVAAMYGPEKCPYGDHRTYRGGVTFARAYIREWEEGYERGQELKRLLRDRAVA